MKIISKIGLFLITHYNNFYAFNLQEISTLSSTKQPSSDSAQATADKPETGKSQVTKPKEIGGPKGPEPTRYGDWEKKGRCIDF